MNPIKLMQMRNAMAQFEKRHPKLRSFIKTVTNNALKDGTVIEVKVTTPDGKNYVTNMKLTEEDIKLFKEAEKKLHK